MKRALLFSSLLAATTALFAFVCGACGNDPPPATPAPPRPAPPPPATAPPTPPPPAAPPFDGAKVAKNACLACHRDDMLAQQRLTVAQWTKVVTKMKGWGADLQDGEIAPLSAWLADHYGSDAGPWTAPRANVSAFPAELDKTPDGPFANGDVARGKKLYDNRCMPCHGTEARGDVGVILVDRPFLWRAKDVADVVRQGKGKMPAMQLTDGEVGDVLAFLRTLKTPLP